MERSTWFACLLYDILCIFPLRLGNIFIYIYIYFIVLFLFLQQLFATMLKYQILTPIFINKMESVAIYLRYKFIYSEVIRKYVST